MTDKIQEVKDICVSQLLVPFEGYAKKLPDGSCMAYPDPASKLVKLSRAEVDKLTSEEVEFLGRPWTIGYGSTFDEDGNPIKPGDIWTHERAVAVKQIALNKFLNILFAMSPGLFNEKPEKIAAVLSWIYNCGSGNYRISTYKKRIDAKIWSEAAQEGLKWNKANGKIMRGLTARRIAEGRLLLQ